MSYGIAFAQEATQPPAAGGDVATYLLGLGPLGTIAALAFWLGKGVKLTVQVDLSDADRRLLERSVDALEQRGSRRRASDA
jgi:urocanate hydratase